MLKVEGSQYPHDESDSEGRKVRLPLTAARRANNLTMCITGSALTDGKQGFEVGADDEYSESYLIAVDDNVPCAPSNLLNRTA